MQYYGIDWLATVCGLTGVFLLGNKNKYGFLIFMMASASWVMIGSSIFFFMHFRGWLA